MSKTRIGILGGGPSALFLFKRLVESGNTDISVTIFERKNVLGAGMPYSSEGALNEHITNISANEIPEILKSFKSWVTDAALKKYGLNKATFNEYRVLPRLLFGKYLSSQFDEQILLAKSTGIECQILHGCEVADVIDLPKLDIVTVVDSNYNKYDFEHVIICTGHNWHKNLEGRVAGYYDSPYPPSKLVQKFNHPIAIRGTSLTAIDAIKTIARNNGVFRLNVENELEYHLHPDSKNLRIVMHSKNGLLPAVRFHTEDPHLKNPNVLTEEEIKQHILENDGFLSLDFIFEMNFKRLLRDKQPNLYERVKDYSVEQFVQTIMELREELDPFILLKAEMAEADKSIKTEQSVFWKELIGILSFEMNYPAKYFSAEDMIRLKRVLMPLISLIISYAPQDSVEELLVLHKMGILDIVAVGEQSEVGVDQEDRIYYKYIDSNGVKHCKFYTTFVDCIGQRQLSVADIPFRSLVNDQVVSAARLKFRDPENAIPLLETHPIILGADGNNYLTVAGVAINDHFQVLDAYNSYNDRIYIMAVPYMGGYNPDYSGLDFCEAASLKIVSRMLG